MPVARKEPQEPNQPTCRGCLIPETLPLKAYGTTNPTIATVTKKGVIKGKKKGKCYVYAYVQNGVFAKIKVTVK